MIEHILRKNRNLKYYNVNNMSDRLLKQSNGNLFFAINRSTGIIEMHSILSFKLDPQNISLNAHVKPKFFNDWVIKDFRSTETRRFLKEKQDEREYSDTIHDWHQEMLEKKNIEHGLSGIKEILGRDL